MTRQQIAGFSSRYHSLGWSETPGFARCIKPQNRKETRRISVATLDRMSIVIESSVFSRDFGRSNRLFASPSDRVYDRYVIMSEISDLY